MNKSITEKRAVSPLHSIETDTGDEVRVSLDKTKKAIIEKLIYEVQTARGISARADIGSSLIIKNCPAGSGPKLIAEALEKGDIASAEYYLALEKWNPILDDLFPNDKPSVPQQQPMLSQIGPLSWPNITFSGGVPVGGWSTLTLWPDGAYEFDGHFRVSGAPSYNDSLAWAIKDNTTNTAYTFSHNGHLAGTFESGSRDDNWSVSGKNPAIATAWANLSAGFTSHASAAVNWDANAIVNEAVSGVGIVLSVVGIIVA